MNSFKLIINNEENFFQTQKKTKIKLNMFINK
jgi:hypothetical protein